MVKFVTAANRRMAKELNRLEQSAETHSLDLTVYDLGGIGHGTPFLIKDNTFQTLGYYRTTYTEHPSRSIHKASVVMDFINRQPAGTVIAYLDADTEIIQTIDEIQDQPFDIGLTVHPNDQQPIIGWLNAGVIFFQAGEKARLFIESWLLNIQSIGNDQEALKQTAKSSTGINITEFPSPIYNFRHVTKNPPPPTAKIVHHMASLGDPAIMRLWQMKGI